MPLSETIRGIRLRRDLEHVDDHLASLGLDASPEATERLFQGEDEAICIFDRSGKVLAASPRYRQLFPETDDVSPLPEAPRSKVAELACQLHAMVASGAVERIEAVHQCESAALGPVTLRTVCLPLFDARRNLAGVAAICQTVAVATPQICGLTDDQVRDRATQIGRMPEKERRVLQLVCRGHSNKEIAVRLDAPLRTIENRRRRIMDQMGVQSLAELVKLTVRLQDAKLIDLGI